MKFVTVTCTFSELFGMPLTKEAFWGQNYIELCFVFLLAYKSIVFAFSSNFWLHGLNVPRGHIHIYIYIHILGLVHTS